MKRVMVVVENTSQNDYVAFVEGNRDYWGSGESTAAAIGNLITHYPGQFSAEIKKSTDADQIEIGVGGLEAHNR